MGSGGLAFEVMCLGQQKRAVASESGTRREGESCVIPTNSLITESQRHGEFTLGLPESRQGDSLAFVIYSAEFSSRP